MMNELKKIAQVFALPTLVGIIMTNCGLTFDSRVTDITFLIMAALIPCMLHVFETSSLDKEIKNAEFKLEWTRRKLKVRENVVLYVLVSVLVYFILHIWLGDSTLELWSNIAKNSTIKVSAEMTALGFIGGTIGVELCAIVAMKGAKSTLKKRLDMGKRVMKGWRDKEKEAAQ